jgi:hypothetical protein
MLSVALELESRIEDQADHVEGATDKALLGVCISQPCETW